MTAGATTAANMDIYSEEEFRNEVKSNSYKSKTYGQNQTKFNTNKVIKGQTPGNYYRPQNQPNVQNSSKFGESENASNNQSIMPQQQQKSPYLTDQATSHLKKKKKIAQNTYRQVNHEVYFNDAEQSTMNNSKE